VKEALHNIVKHAQARIVWLRLVEHPGGFALAVEDDGRGFTPGAEASAGQADRAAPGRGLGNLHERLAAIGGRCTIASKPGAGTRVRLEVPIA